MENEEVKAARAYAGLIILSLELFEKIVTEHERIYPPKNRSPFNSIGKNEN